jgi:ribonuclease VapC
MMIDSSAIVALLFGEAEAPVFLDALTSSGPKSMSVFTRLESAIVVEAWKGEPGARALSRLLVEAEVEIIAFDSGQAEVALDA